MRTVPSRPSTEAQPAKGWPGPSDDNNNHDYDYDDNDPTFQKVLHRQCPHNNASLGNDDANDDADDHNKNDKDDEDLNRLFTAIGRTTMQALAKMMKC